MYSKRNKILFKLINLLKKMKTKFWTTISQIIFKLWGVEYGNNLSIRGYVFVESRGTINLGNNVTINSAPWANPIGGADRTYFQVFPDAELLIGSGCGISNSAITARKSVRIGNNVLIGAGCRIYDTDFHPIESKYRYGEYKSNNYIISRSIVIDDGAFIGGGSILLKGCHIGKNSIIGAGSVVTGIVPDGEVWGGNPAKYIKKIKMS